MSFISTLLYRKKQAKEQKSALSKEAISSEEELAEGQEEAGTIFDHMISPSKAEFTDEEDDQEEYELVEREILPDKIICPDCGGITLEGLEFCDKCGGELQ